MTTNLLFGDTRTGRILGEIDATGCVWETTLNAAGSINGVTVTEDVVRLLDLRWTAAAARTFLAVELDDRIQEAGPIWSRPWNDEAGILTLGATGLWGLFNQRKLLPPLIGDAPNSTVATARIVNRLTGADYGEIARAAVAQVTAEYGGDLPLLLPDPRPGGAVVENLPGYELRWAGRFLTELTQRESGAPDIRFRPRRNPEDRRFLQWVMDTGTAAQPLLVQAGADWVFDHTARRSPVVRISTDEDATVMAMRAFAIGSGMEAAQLLTRATDTRLLDAGWPLLEVDEMRPTVEKVPTLQGHANRLLARSARPIESWQVVVRAAAAAEVLPGDYCRVRPKADNAWLGRVGERRMRVYRKSGDLGDNVTLTMYPLEAIL